MTKRCPNCKEKFEGMWVNIPGFFTIHSTKTATINKLDGIMVCTSTWITGRTKKEWSKTLLTAPEALLLGSGLSMVACADDKFNKFWDAEMRKARIKQKRKRKGD